MSGITYIDKPPHDGRAKFPQLIEQIREDGYTGEWAILKVYTNHFSANDASNRLRRKYDDFEFTSRAGVVYALYREGNE